MQRDISVRKVDETSFAEAYQLLKALDGDRISEADWKGIFDYEWTNPEDHCGYGMFDGRKMVGYIGCLFSVRLIEGNSSKYCNITSWIVDEAYRDYGIFLLRPLLRQKALTLTDFTPTATVLAILLEFGFKTMDSSITLLRRAVTSGFLARKTDVSICVDHAEIGNRLSEEDLILFKDHQSFDCGHALLQAGSEYCYLIFVSGSSGLLKNCHIQFISNRSFFGQYSEAIRYLLAKEVKTWSITVDTRLIDGLDLPQTLQLFKGYQKVFRSNEVGGGDIDNLYSEYFVLGLPPVTLGIALKKEILRSWLESIVAKLKPMFSNE